ncbi:STAS domain-containing protein [Streptomyces phaeoluteigriseus]|uniref:STAS domain-containing protein n=1 Tax=Streptomyces phaeoluteigriseus TaxID=114686 RepID=A0ABY4ZAY0_9ACTN|nr:STAS domain-containing protein [Streptomyces phaeoluteigriseus]USQ85482.1 STAS domain-containing protein [Streptomyces phaeoluteigriseus]
MLTVLMQHEGTVVAQLPEQVDYDNATLVGAQCEDLVRHGCATLVLDASRVDYLDSSGISMIIKLSRILGDHAGTLRVANFNAHYHQVWRLLGLDSLFPVSPTVQAALGPRWNGSASGMTISPPPSGW